MPEKIKVVETYRNVCTDCHMKGESYQGYVTKRVYQMNNGKCQDCKKSFHMLFTISLT